MQINFEMLLTIMLLFVQVALGLYILYRAGRTSAGFSFAGFCLSVFLWTIAAYLLKNAKSSEEILLWGNYIFAGPILIAYFFVYFSYVFPGGEIKRAIKLLFFVPTIILLIIAPFDLITKKGYLSPLGPTPIIGPAYPFFAFYFMAYFVLGIYNLVIKYRKTKGNERTQVAYVITGLLFSFILGMFFNLIIPIFHLNQPINPIIGPYFTMIYIVFAVYALTKHHLMDISIIISRAIAELITIIFLGTVYIALACLYRSYLSVKIDLPYITWTILYGILVGEVHNRIRLFVQTTADKVFLKGKYNYYKELSEISSQITRSLSVENIHQTLHKAFYEVLEVSSPKIYVEEDLSKPEVKGYLLMEEPSFQDKSLILPCRIENRTIALIILGPKLSEDAYTDEDIRLLKALANQTAVALDHHRMYEEMLKAQKELLVSEKMVSLGKVASDFANEIKKPLLNMKESVKAIQWDKIDRATAKNVKDTMLKETSLLNESFDDLFKLVKKPKTV